MDRKRGLAVVLLLAAFTGASGPAFAKALAGGQDDKKAQEDDANKKLEEFNAALKKAKTESEIVDAIAELGKTRHPKILQKLKTFLGKSKDITSAAAEEIGKYSKDKEAAEILMAAANSQRDVPTAVKCVRSAGDTSYRGIAAKLVALYRHKDIEVAHEAIDSSAKIKSKACVTPLIQLLKELEAVRENDGTGAGSPNMPDPGGLGASGQNHEDERLKRKHEFMEPILEALRATTGEKWTTAKDWESWWQKAQATFKELD